MAETHDQIILSFPLFAGYTAYGAQKIIERGQVRNLSPGEILFKEGDPASSVLLVLTGSLQVFLERGGRDLILTNAGPGTILGELGVLCGLPRTASIRALDASAVLQWSDDAFRGLIVSDHMLSERIFRQSLRTLIDKERSMIDSLLKTQGELP